MSPIFDEESPSSPTNGQVERFNKTIVARLCHFVHGHQTNCDQFLQPLMLAYNSQMHRLMVTTPLNLLLPRHPPDPAMSNPPFSYRSIFRHSLSPAHFASAFCKTLLCSEHEPNEHGKCSSALQVFLSQDRSCHHNVPTRPVHVCRLLA